MGTQFFLVILIDIFFSENNNVSQVYTYIPKIQKKKNVKNCFIYRPQN
jgi:hypothetical protein